MHFMNTKGVEYSAAVTSKKPGSSRTRAEASEFRKSKLNPRNQSRTLANKVSGHAPSSRVLEYARRSARALAELAMAPSSAWKLLEDVDGGVLLYELAADDTRRLNDRDYYAVRAVATVDAVVDDVLSLVDAPTTEELTDAGRGLFGKYFHAGVTLNKLTCSTPPSSSSKYSPDDAYSVHWLSLRSVTKLGSVENHRDTTAVSYQDAFDQSTPALSRVGRSAVRARRDSKTLMGVHSLVSTTLPDVPPLPKSEATDRVHFRDSGLVVEPLSPGLSRVSLVLSLLPPAGSASSTEAKKKARRSQKWLQTVAAAGVAALAALVTDKFPQPSSSLSKENQPGNMALSMQPVEPRQWRESDHCYICLKVFRAFRRQHHCRFCGEAVCGTCSGFVDGLTGRSVDSGDWSSGSGSGSGSSTDSLAGRERASSSDKTGNASTLRACNACAYELDQRLSGVVSAGERHSAASSSNSDESISLSLYSVDREPATGGFALSLPDFDDVLDERSSNLYGPPVPYSSSSNRPNAPMDCCPPPPSAQPAYEFAMALQRGKLNASVPFEASPKKLWTSADSLSAAMRGLEQYNASLSTASSSLLSQGSGAASLSGSSRYYASTGSVGPDSLSVASLSIGDASSHPQQPTPSRFVDVAEEELHRHLDRSHAPYAFSSFSQSSDGVHSAVGSASVSSASSSSSFTDVTSRPRNDMIPLAPPPSAKPQFVVFSGADAASGSDSTSSSVSSEAGGDMIPLTLL